MLWFRASWIDLCCTSVSLYKWSSSSTKCANNFKANSKVIRRIRLARKLEKGATLKKILICIGKTTRKCSEWPKTYTIVRKCEQFAVIVRWATFYIWHLSLIGLQAPDPAIWHWPLKGWQALVHVHVHGCLWVCARWRRNRNFMCERNEINKWENKKRKWWKSSVR